MTTLAVQAGRWYHVAATWRNSDKSYRLRVWDDTAGTVTEITGNGSYSTDTTGAAWEVGRMTGWNGPGSCFDGLIDELVVCKDILSATEIDLIRQGSYGGDQVPRIVLQDITYNSRGQKATTRGPYPEDYNEPEYAVNYTQYTYDALGRLWKVTDAEGHVTTTRYYPDGKVWKVIDANDCNSVVNRYYGDGSLKEVEDAKGNITRYEYNGFKGLKKDHLPG